MDRLHKSMRVLDIIFSISLMLWLLWSLFADKSLYYSLMIVFFLVINILLTIFQPSKHILNNAVKNAKNKKPIKT